jgi:hypothetical protein
MLAPNSVLRVEAKIDGGSRSADTPLSIKEIQDNLQKAEGDETYEA